MPKLGLVVFIRIGFGAVTAERSTASKLFDHDPTDQIQSVYFLLYLI
jgi:hypothetical protein